MNSWSHRVCQHALLAVVACWPALATAQQPEAASARLSLNEHDRIVIIGNTLAERMQYFGHFETWLHQRFPNLGLSVRNLGFSCDEVDFRPRSLNFGSPDDHLTRQRADVVIAFFGFNESFAGAEGRTSLASDLREFISHTRRQRYNGASSPKLAIVSPIAWENLGDPNLPDGTTGNARLETYVATMRGVADELDVLFVDLWTPTHAAMQRAEQPWTFNGVHLSDDGYRRLAPLLGEALFGAAHDETPRVAADYERLRREVQEKDYQFFHVYRAVNGYYIYGDRSRRDHGNPPYPDNYVMTNERAKLDEMAAIRDTRIWRVARGESIPDSIDDSSTRELYDVPTNFERPIEILPPEVAETKFEIADGYAINLFASEVEYPELKNPVQLTFDSQGRLWVATMPSYPGYQPPHKPDDKLLVFEDVDGDGRADRQTVFADGLHLPTGFEIGDGGVYVAQEPNLVFLADTDGDGRADLRKRVLHGFDSAASHHAIGAFQWGPGGGLYLHEGTFHHTAVETPYGPVRNAHGAVYRYDPTRQHLETFVSYNFHNPWGHAFDRWGQNFIADASDGHNYFATPISVKATPFRGQPDFGPFRYVYRTSIRPFIKKRVRPTSGCEFVSSDHFPPEAQGNLLVNNCIGFQGILQHRLFEEESGFRGVEIEPLLFSTDPNFRPVDLIFGPDGALYVVDWFNPLVGHMQHSLRDPNRDHTHGRIWRITYPSRPLADPPRIEGRSIAELLELLKSPTARTRNLVRVKLRSFPASEVVTAVEQWIRGLSDADPQLEHHLLEALWVHQHHNAVNEKLLHRVLHSPDYRARAAATRVLCFWRDALPDPIALLREQAHDDHPRVRLEVIRATSYFASQSAIEVAMAAADRGQDYYLAYALGETLRQLRPFWKPKLLSGGPMNISSAARSALLQRLDTAELLAAEESVSVLEARARRYDIPRAERLHALQQLVTLRGSRLVDEVLDAIRVVERSADGLSLSGVSQLAGILLEQPTEELLASLPLVQQMAIEGHTPLARRAAIAVMLKASGSLDAVNRLIDSHPQRRVDVFQSLPLARIDDLHDDVFEITATTIRNLTQQRLSTDDEALLSAAIDALGYLPDPQSKAFQLAADLFVRGIDRVSAVGAMARMRLEDVETDELHELADAVEEYVRSLPDEELADAAAQEVIQFGKSLATHLSPPRAATLRGALRGLGAQVIRIRPVPNALRFDRAEIAVAAGKPVILLFENIDVMPHNLVVTEEGPAFDKVVELSIRMQKDPLAFDRHFVPHHRHRRIPEVLLATKLLHTGESETLRFVAPDDPGTYRYVCTFPNHQRSMNGILHVVSDLEAFLASHPLPAVEATEKIRTQVIKNYDVSDLLGHLDWEPGTRSYTIGQRIFREASCARCHHIDGRGDLTGPDLSMLDPIRSRQELLQSLVQPSAKIDDKYRGWIFTVSGQIKTGFVLEEDDERYVINERPGEVCEPTIIAKSDLDEPPVPAAVSVMPKNLLDTLTVAEIQDLIAYIHARGDRGDSVFSSD